MSGSRQRTAGWRPWSLVMVFVAAFSGSCGGGSPAGPDVVTPPTSYIPDFTFVWRNQADNDHQYNFQPVESGVATGQFDESSSETFGGTVNPIVGGYSNRTLTFTVTRPTETLSVTGRFLTDDTIELRWPNTVITVERFDPSQ